MKDLIKELNMIPGIHFDYYCSDESDPGQYEFGCCSNFCSAIDLPDWWDQVHYAGLYWHYLKDTIERAGYIFVFHTFSNQMFIETKKSGGNNFMDKSK